MATWNGAIDFRGFPVNLAFSAQKKSTRGPGFKNIGPDGLPPIGKSFEASTGREIDGSEIGKAVSVGRGKAAVLQPLTAEQHEAITSQEKTRVMEADSFAPIETVPFELALMAYVVTPDPNVAGADRAAAVLWNGLRGSGLAYIAQATIASRDSVVAIWATDTQLKAVSLPFEQEMYPEPSYDWTVDEAQATVFAQAIADPKSGYETKPFELSAYASEYAQRREEVIESVLAGQPVTVAAAPQPQAETPDLMGMLTQLVSEVEDRKAPVAKKRTPAKPKTPVKA